MGGKAIKGGAIPSVAACEGLFKTTFADWLISLSGACSAPLYIDLEPHGIPALLRRILGPTARLKPQNLRIRLI